VIAQMSDERRRTPPAEEPCQAAESFQADLRRHDAMVPGIAKEPFSG
jgi:hypothetical protein